MRTSVADHTLWEVLLKSGRVVQGTEQELDARFPHANWKRVARPVPRALPTRRTPDDEDDDGEDDPRSGRLPSSSVNYLTRSGQQRVHYEVRPQQTIPRRTHAQPRTHAGQVAVSKTEDAPAAVQCKQRRGRHPLWYLGLGMVAMLLVWQGVSALGQWWHLHSDDATYGRPRTFQLDAVVGHNHDSAATPSHFLLLNLNRHIEVIEFPAGDGSKARIYLGPTIYTDGGELIPVTGECVDVNGDGKPDLIVKIEDQRIVWIKTGDGFRPLKPGEHITLPPN